MQPANEQERVNYPKLKLLTNRNFVWTSHDFAQLHPNEIKWIRDNSVGSLGDEILQKLD